MGRNGSKQAPVKRPTGSKPENAKFKVMNVFSLLKSDIENQILATASQTEKLDEGPDAEALGLEIVMLRENLGCISAHPDSLADTSARIGETSALR